MSPESNLLFVHKNRLETKPPALFQVKGKKKFPAAVAEKMKTVCIYASEEGEEETFHSSGFEKACRMAAVLEYVKYENEDVKAVMDTLMAQAAEAAKGSVFLQSRKDFVIGRHFVHIQIHFDKCRRTALSRRR